MKNVALALMAVLAMASVSMAGTFVYEVVDNGIVELANPGADVLRSYTVKIGGTDSIGGALIDGQVYNASYMAGVPVPVRNGLVWAADIEVSTWDAYPELRAADTHFLVDKNTLTQGSVIDTNGTDNPAGVNLYGFAQAGWGTFTGSLFGLPFGYVLEPGTPILQVVLKDGDSVMLELDWVDSVTGLDDHSSIPIGGTVIPEPGTIMLLLTGVLCLMGIRRR